MTQYPCCYRDASVACDGSCRKLVFGGACLDLVTDRYDRA